MIYQKSLNSKKKFFKIYNEGKIKYPIHLTKGNEGQLKKYLNILVKMIGFFAVGEIMLMLYCMDFLKKNYLIK